MNDALIANTPSLHALIAQKTGEIGFLMPSDLHVGSLLKSLVASKPGGKFLELGTGTGLSLSWMADGMDEHSTAISIDNDPELISIAHSFFEANSRVQILCEDGAKWLNANQNERFDLIFADAWPGKYSELNLALNLLKPGGFYVIDDMLPQPNWPEGHAEKAEKLIETLDQREDLAITKINWSTGIIIGVKKR